MALEMLREDLQHPSEDAGVLHQVALTLAEASGRVAEIEREIAPPG
jgi:hypothetical protein